ncbi:hypothetical protein [Erysipelothrix tonsillarum]|uniref:hypothetical protein n=1 Tax=Erysipelothrix tonsillarum TaxID=38402 RepID=UPI0039C78D58
MTTQNQENAIVVNPTSEEQTEQVTVQDQFTGRSVQFYSSIQDDGSREAKIKIYNALNESGVRLADQVNKTLSITDLAAFPVQIVTEETGEIVDAMRMIFIAEDGEQYASVATGVYSSMQKILGIVGPAPWTPALKITPIRQRTRRGFETLVIRLVADEETQEDTAPAKKK